MDTTATLIDNIMTKNQEARMETGLVTVRVSDHLPIFAFSGGWGGTEGCVMGRGAPKDSLARKVVIGGRIRQFFEKAGGVGLERGESNRGVGQCGAV